MDYVTDSMLYTLLWASVPAFFILGCILGWNFRHFHASLFLAGLSLWYAHHFYPSANMEDLLKAGLLFSLSTGLSVGYFPKSIHSLLMVRNS